MRTASVDLVRYNSATKTIEFDIPRKPHKFRALLQFGKSVCDEPTIPATRYIPVIILDTAPSQVLGGRVSMPSKRQMNREASAL
jgi:hypothetical protein